MENCLAETKSGNPCKGKPLDNGFCFAHQPKNEPVTPKVCGHINKHNWQYIAELGKSELQDIACELKPGHPGDHSAMKYEISFRDNGLAEEGEKAVYWNDSAGVPVEEIEPDISSLPQKAQKEHALRTQEEKSMRALGIK